MAKFNPTITAYLVPYIREGYDNKKFCYWMSLLLKVVMPQASVYILCSLRASVYISGKTLMPMV